MSIFSNTNTNQGNIFSRSPGQAGQGGNIFTQGQTNQNTSIFGQNNNQSNNIFGNNQNNTGGLFNQNQQSGGSNTQGTLFSGNNQTGGNLFSNQGGTQGTLFSNQGGAQGNIFGGNTQTGTLFTNQGSYNQSGSMTGAPNQWNQVNEAQLMNLLTASEEEQKKLFQAFVPDYIKQLIALYRKNLQPSKVQRLILGTDNNLRNQKLNKVAGTLNIKNQLIQLKRLIRDNVTLKVKKLKENKDRLENLSLDFSAKVYDKLQKYKEKLVISVTQSKMMEEIRKEVDELDQQINDFFKPLFNSYQNRTNYSFVDPDPFCLNIAQKILRNTTVLDNKMDELLACEAQPSEQNFQTGEVIVQLVEYYQNVATTLKEFSEKYNKLKYKMVNKSNQVNPGEVLRKITEKANSSVSKEMETYDLVKDIENLLKKREGKNQDRTKI